MFHLRYVIDNETYRSSPSQVPRDIQWHLRKLIVYHPLQPMVRSSDTVDVTGEIPN